MDFTKGPSVVEQIKKQMEHLISVGGLTEGDILELLQHMMDKVGVPKWLQKVVRALAKGWGK